MILAAGLTPAWQQIMRFRKLELGEVNRAAEVHWCASGKVLNAGMALAALGAISHTLSPAGGWSGEAMRAEFTQRDIPATWLLTSAPSRICTTLLDDATRASTELVENATTIPEYELHRFVDAFERLASSAEFAVLTGSLPSGTPPTFYRMLLHRTRCSVVLDVRGPELMAALECNPRVVKPNREELAMTVGRPLPDRAAVMSAMRELIERGAQAVVVTQGKSAVWIKESNQAWELTPPDVTPIVNPIGCGDCLAAAIAIGLTRGDSLVEAVRFGMAAAADNVTQLLPARLSTQRVADILGRIPAPIRLASN